MEDSPTSSSSKSSSEGSSSIGSADVPPRSPPFARKTHNQENRNCFQVLPSPDPEPLALGDLHGRLEQALSPPVESSASPWILHPLVDGRFKWGDVTPSRAREMIRASEIARYFGDRDKLGLPAKPAIPAKQWLKEVAMANEIQTRRDKAIEAIKRIHSKLQQLKSSSTSSAALQSKEVSDLAAALTNYLQMAFSPNPNLQPEAIDPMMAQIFAELVDAYAVQLQESIELATKIRAMQASLAGGKSHPHGGLAGHAPPDFNLRGVSALVGEEADERDERLRQ